MAGTGGILGSLYFVHRKQRDVEREKRLQYWREQNAFHKNLMQMREAALSGILSLPTGSNSGHDSPRNDFRDPDGPKPTGMRNYYVHDQEYDDKLVGRKPIRF